MLVIDFDIDFFNELVVVEDTIKDSERRKDKTKDAVPDMVPLIDFSIFLETLAVPEVTPVIDFDILFNRDAVIEDATDKTLVYKVVVVPEPIGASENEENPNINLYPY